MKPAILHLRASNFVGGPEKQILTYALSTADQVETIIASFCDDHEGTALLREAASLGIKTLALPASSLIKSVRALTLAVRESNVRLLCAHGFKPAVAAAIVSRLTGVPYACFLRGWTRENTKVALYESLERLCARIASRVVCLSETQAARLRPVYKSRLRVVVNSAELRNYSPEQRFALKQEICRLAALDPAFPLAVAAGRLSPEKGMAVLVKAAAILRSSTPELQFALFGDGVERARLQQMISDAGLDSTFKLVGHHNNFSELVAGADIVVNPSLTEQMPNVVLEAMSAGVPVVATVVGGVPELGEGGAIKLVTPGQPQELAAAIEQLCSDPTTRCALVQNASARLRQYYSRQIQAEQLRSLYSEFVLLPRRSRTHSLPRISIIIPVRNEEEHISAVLEAFRNQVYPPELFEIIVADGVSTDRTADIIDNFASLPGPVVRLVKNSGRLSSRGRNAGVTAASGEIIIFSDGHCHIPSRTLLRDAADLFAESGAGILCRPQPLDFPGNSSFQHAVAAARASWLGHGRDSTIYSTTFEGWVDPSSAGAIYRRELFERFGGMDEGFDACEDVEFNYRLHRAGVKAYISPKLTVLYEPRKRLIALFRQLVRYGRGRVRLARKYPGSGSWSQLVPAALLLLIVAGLIAPFTPLFRGWTLVIAAYLGIVLVESFRVATRIGAAKFVMLPLVFMAIHTGLGTGMVLEWMTGERKIKSRVPVFFPVQKNAHDEGVKIPAPSNTPQEIGTT